MLYNTKSIHFWKFGLFLLVTNELPGHRIIFIRIDCRLHNGHNENNNHDLTVNMTQDFSHLMRSYHGVTKYSLQAYIKCGIYSNIKQSIDLHITFIIRNIINGPVHSSKGLLVHVKALKLKSVLMYLTTYLIHTEIETHERNLSLPITTCK